MVKDNEVVLFMKGTRLSPQCGFSATVVDILDDFLPEYLTVDVLVDPHVRAGIKEFSEWPTIPQLYVKGKFVGGSDIIKELRSTGELEKVLGTGPRPVDEADVTISNKAISALTKHWDGDGKPLVRLEIDRRYENSMYFDEQHDSDIVVEHEKYILIMDRGTMRRARGVTIDWLTGKRGSGFKIDNPGAPPRVQPLMAEELKKLLDEGKPLELFDVRTPEERARARIEGSTLLDPSGMDRLEALKRDTALVLYCHHGTRSQAAAEHCLKMGFKEVYNLSGGIDAWSQEVDSSVPRY